MSDQNKIFDPYVSSYFGRIHNIEKLEKSYEIFTRYYGKNILKFLPLSKDAKIVDLGCGIGHLLYFFKKQGYRDILGIDISEEAVVICKSKGFPVEKDDIFNFTKVREDNRFDVITMIDVLEHQTKEKAGELLDQCRRILKPDGVLIIRVPNMNNFLMAGLTRYSDYTHELGFNDRSLYQVLYLANFRDIKISPSNIYVFYKNPLNWAAILASKIFDNIFQLIFHLYGSKGIKIFTKTIFAVAKKGENGQVVKNQDREKAAVIIANWNGKKYLEDCLSSLRNQTYKNFITILVDNGSKDDSIDFVRNNFPEVNIISLPENQGFARANNIGIREAFRDESVGYIVTLNNDTKTDTNYLEELVRCARSHPDAGSIQPKVLSFQDEKIIDSTGVLIYFDASAISRGQKEKDVGQYEKEEEIFGSSASAALYTRGALEKVKLPHGNYFDESYFAYYEDVDLAWRLRLAGWKSYYCPSSKILHVGSATGRSYSSFKAFHIHRNQYYNIIKNLPLFFALRALAFMPIRYLFLVTSIIRKKGPAAMLAKNIVDDSIPKIVIRSWKEILVTFPELLRARKIVQKTRKVKAGTINKWFIRYKANLNKMIFS
jgi:GT2 family glycosyltransferase/SAM-dependent methyltransferase